VATLELNVVFAVVSVEIDTHDEHFFIRMTQWDCNSIQVALRYLCIPVICSVGHLPAY
jgi:hypothetical protein